MERLFANGTYRGQGRWIDRNAQGGYTAQYTIKDGPQARGSISVTIRSPQGSVAGTGYAFDGECHYELDIVADNHLEFTFHAELERLHGLGSATNKGNWTYWQESLTRM